MLKIEKKRILDNRLEDTLREVYHNATPHYPYIEDESLHETFNKAFDWWVECEIDYMNEGLGVSKPHKYNHSERHIYLINKLIKEYGKLSQYGRGGRTLAPRNLVVDKHRWQIKAGSIIDDLNREDKTQLILMLDAFNIYVNNWCSKDNLIQLWKNHCEDLKYSTMDERDHTKIQITNLAREIGSQIFPENICATLKEKIKNLRHERTELNKRIFALNAQLQ